MKGFRFSQFIPEENSKVGFDQLLKIFMQLLNITAGDVAEALSYLNEIDKEYNLTSDEYAIGDFIEELKEKGYIKEDGDGSQQFNMTAKSEIAIRKQALEEIFSKLRKGNRGNHNTPYSGFGDESTSERRNYQFGDSLDQIDMTTSIKMFLLFGSSGSSKWLATRNTITKTRSDRAY